MLTLLAVAAPLFEASQAASICQPFLYLVSVGDSVASFPRAVRKFRAIRRRAVGQTFESDTSHACTHVDAEMRLEDAAKMLLRIVPHLRSIPDDLIEDAGRFAKMRDLFCCHFEASQATSLCRPLLYLVSVCDSIAPFPRAARKFRAIGSGRGAVSKQPSDTRSM